MRTAIRTIITDLKAAVRIGHPDAIFAALEGLLAETEISSNQVLTEEYISTVILPVGRVLSHTRIPASVLDDLADDNLSAFRAIAVVGSTLHILDNNETNLEKLTGWANDPRADIRAALIAAISADKTESESIINLIAVDWLQSDHQRVQQSGLQLVANMASPTEDVLDWIASLGRKSNPEINQDIVSVLNKLAQGGNPRGVLSLLKDWMNEAPPNTWVITRALTGSWAAQHPAEALHILKSLALHHASHKQIVSALRALIRHGATKAVQSEIVQWQVNKDDNLRAIAEKVT